MMDWPAVARTLAERADYPVAVVDGGTTIHLVNRAMEEVLGWDRFAIEGQSWIQTCSPDDREQETARWLTEALRGALKSHEAVAVTKGGSKVVLHFEFLLVGHATSQGLLMTATRVVSQPAFSGYVPGREVDYEVSTAGTDFGLLGRLHVDGKFVSTDPQSHCYTQLYGLGHPCSDCPILRDTAKTWPRTLVRYHTRQTSGNDGSFEIVIAEQLSTTRVRLRLRTVSENSLEAVHAAKIQHLAARADLSRREREVFNYLLLGRSASDIGKLLGISVRTVKHHQARLLDKLGADSRSDLMRLVL